MTLDSMLNLPFEKRKEIFLQHVKQNQALWILTDNDGAVMLVAEDEDCIPVWPTQEAAKVWKEAEWAHCEAHKIELSEWVKKWTPGMAEDDLLVVIFPVPGENAMTSFADELDKLLG